MAKQGGPKPQEGILELLRDMLILQLRLAGAPQDDIPKIARCGINRVNGVLKRVPRCNR